MDGVVIFPALTAFLDEHRTRLAEVRREVRTAKLRIDGDIWQCAIDATLHTLGAQGRVDEEGYRVREALGVEPSTVLPRKTTSLAAVSRRRASSPPPRWVSKPDLRMAATEFSAAPPLPERRYRILAAIVLLFAPLCFLASCSSNKSESSDSTSGVISPSGTAAPLQLGDARFLLGRGDKIQTITLSGDQTTLVTLEDSHRVIELALSPDRNRFVFVVELPAYANGQGNLDYGADLYISNLDGSNAHLLLKHDTVGDYFQAPTWLDDSTLIVGWRGFDGSGSTARIERLNVETGEREVLMRDVAMGTLSPDRRSIVYSTIDPKTNVQRLVIQDLAGKESPRVLVDEDDNLTIFFSVVFSPDGSRLAFAALDIKTAVSPSMPGPYHSFGLTAAATHPATQDVWLVNPIDGTGLQRVADLAESLPSASWSGDGSLIYVFGSRFLWSLDPATGAAKMLLKSGDRGSIVWLEGS